MINEVKKLVDELNSYRMKYYNGEDTGVTDEEFDFKERRLKELDPNNQYFYQVGAKTQTRDIPVEHEYPMLSMQKEQTAEAVVDWFFDIQQKFPNLYFEDGIPSLWYEPKFDGISGKIVYDQDGNYKLASTRGDGTVGALIPFGIKIKGVIPKYIPNSELRGEFIIPKRYSREFSGPLRNSCSGILKRKEESDELKYVNFVTYDVHYYDNTYRPNFKNRLDKLLSIIKVSQDLNHFEPIMILPKKTVNIPQVYQEYVQNLREKWEYETDGIILTIDGGQDNYDMINSRYSITTCNRYNMALKPPAEFGSSEVINIHSSVNRMKISFVAQIKPIYINGVLVQRATLDNYQNMKRMKIGIGSTVLMKRSNDVIPKIVESYNEEGKEIKFIDVDKCPCCGTPVVKVYQDIMCPNEYGCKDVYASKLEDFLTGLNVKNIGPSIINGIVDYIRYKEWPYTFYSFLKMMNVIDYKLEFGMIHFNGGKRTTNFIESSDYIFKNITELKLLANFNIPYIGEGMLIKAGLTTVEKFLKYKEELDKKIVIEDVFDSRLIAWFKDKRHIEDLMQCYELLKPYFKEVKESVGTEITYCISGEVPGFKNKQEFINKVSELDSNLLFVSSVTSSLDYLVSVETGTSKVLKAKKYKIPVLSPEEFIAKFTK